LTRIVRSSAAAMIAAAAFLAVLAVAWVYWRGGGQPLDPEWVRYRDRFVTDEGRVVDEGRGGVSTSESQGFGLVLATAYNDRITFDRVWSWTRQHLDKREDALFVWRWRPTVGLDGDNNTATDGDLLIAWALARAGAQWDDFAILEEARRRARAIRTFGLLAHELEGKRFFLLPGAATFERTEGIVVNPSYLLFPAFAALQKIDPDWLWGELASTGLRVLEKARFGVHRLPPDWLLAGYDGTYTLAQGFDPVSGYETIRVPLYLMWANFGSEDLLRPFASAWSNSRSGRQIGVVFDLETNAVKARNQGGGFLMIERAVDCALTGYPIPASLKLTPHDDYYSASLYLLTRAMLREAHPDCLSERE
jgi:endoglucanase